MKIDSYPVRLYRSPSDRMLAGICGGIAEYFGWDSSIVRLIFIFIVLIGGSGILAYILLWLILPVRPEQVPVAPRTAIHSSSGSIGGLLLIGLGVLILMQNLGFSQYFQFDKVWPVLLIFFGILILSK